MLSGENDTGSSPAIRDGFPWHVAITTHRAPAVPQPEANDSEAKLGIACNSVWWSA